MYRGWYVYVFWCALGDRLIGKQLRYYDELVILPFTLANTYIISIVCKTNRLIDMRLLMAR